jgi:hypothetical protein
MAKNKDLPTIMVKLRPVTAGWYASVDNAAVPGLAYHQSLTGALRALADMLEKHFGDEGVRVFLARKEER